MSSTELWTEEPWNASLAAAYTLLPAPATSGGAPAVAGGGGGGGGANLDLTVGPPSEDVWNVTGGGLFNASRALNETASVSSPPAFCEGWEALQHNLFQVANLFFCLAFLVPRHFKQSVLLFRFMLAMGCLLTSIWAGFHLCAFDVFAWNMTLLVVNAAHTTSLMVRFLPPALSPDLTELYLKVFKPLKVSKKAFKELAREGAVVTLEPGEKYAEEDLTPADERLSILLKGKLSVSCDGTHLHHINVHQFVDSPEWEANQDTSENTFQVTIAAEEESVYLSWPRIKLSRVLRHRPQVRIVLDTLIGKDITHKLYSLNEQMMGASDRRRQANSDRWRRSMAMSRSISVDAVSTGTRGHVRSSAFRKDRPGGSKEALHSPVAAGQTCWIPVVANHFPASSPFTDVLGQPQPLTSVAASTATALPLTALSGASTSTIQLPQLQQLQQLQQVPSSMALVPVPVIVPVLAPPPTLHQARSRSMRRAGGVSGAVKFEATAV